MDEWSRREWFMRIKLQPRIKISTSLRMGSTVLSVLIALLLGALLLALSGVNPLKAYRAMFTVSC
jgi:ABC-type uncharacterized transport system permease subunit